MKASSGRHPLIDREGFYPRPFVTWMRGPDASTSPRTRPETIDRKEYGLDKLAPVDEDSMFTQSGRLCRPVRLRRQRPGQRELREKAPSLPGGNRAFLSPLMR